ncbi:MAG: amphi-Trp domain-containing protein [Deltaproteobacteria bacterium]|nr:amphi-Trp domain-containing protein [Deltaproteobacteria bacterium]
MSSDDVDTPETIYTPPDEELGQTEAAAEQATAAAKSSGEPDEQDEDGDEHGEDEEDEDEDEDEDDEKSEKDEKSKKDKKGKKDKKDKKGKKDKKDKKKKLKIAYEASMPRAEAVAYFEALVGGLRSGHLEFRQDDRVLVLAPPDHLEIEVEAVQKGSKGKVVFEIEWSSENRPLEIVNEAPTAEGEIRTPDERPVADVRGTITED